MHKTKLNSGNKECVFDYDYVDLGLPSGTMWATCNVGADIPLDRGLLFQFGRVDGYKYGDRKNKFKQAKHNRIDTNNEELPQTTSGRMYMCGDTLDYSDDAASVNMGGNWRMPTRDELEELIDNTTHTVESINKVKGMLFTSNTNNNSIFIPFCGIYDHWDNSYCCKNTWTILFTSNVDKDNEADAYALYFDKENRIKMNTWCRSCGGPIRGVFRK